MLFISDQLDRLYLMYLRISEKSSTRIMWPINSGGERSNTECTVRSSTDHASLWKHIITSVAGSLFKYRWGSLHLYNTKTQLLEMSSCCCVKNSIYHGSRGSGRLRCIDIKSDAYWLNAFFNQPSSTAFFISDDIFVGSMTGRPISPGASCELSTGGMRTPLSVKIYLLIHINMSLSRVFHKF